MKYRSRIYNLFLGIPLLRLFSLLNLEYKVRLIANLYKNPIILEIATFSRL